MKTKDSSTVAETLSVDADWLQTILDDRAESAPPPAPATPKEARMALSPVVAVLLNENANEAFDSALEALTEDGYAGLPKHINRQWLKNRVGIRIVNQADLARKAVRELVDALEDAGRQELALAWALLLIVPCDPTTCWHTIPALTTMVRQQLLGTEDREVFRKFVSAIGVIQKCAEGKLVSEARSLWEILRPMIRDEAGEEAVLDEEAPPASRTAPKKPEGPSVQVMPTAPKLTTDHSEYKPFVGAHLPLVIARDVAGVRRQLRREYPHAVGAVELLTRDLREGEPVRLSPVMLCGPPGCGKSRIGRRMASLLSVPTTRFDAAASADALGWSGSPKGWGNTIPSVPVRAVAQSMTANPILLVDELDKAARTQHGSVTTSIISHLEKETSRTYRDQSLDAVCDLSWISYVATVNDDSGLPTPLRDRFRIVHMPAATLQHLPQLAANVIADIEVDEGVPGIHGALEDDELNVIAGAWQRQRFSIRALQKAVRATLDARSVHAMRH